MRDITYDELCAQCDAAVAALEALSAAAKRDRAALVEVYANIKSTLSGGNLSEDMARVAAITVQSALCEILSPQQLEGGANSTWSGLPRKGWDALRFRRLTAMGAGAGA